MTTLVDHVIVCRNNHSVRMTIDKTLCQIGFPLPGTPCRMIIRARIVDAHVTTLSSIDGMGGANARCSRMRRSKDISDDVSSIDGVGVVIACHVSDFFIVTCQIFFIACTGTDWYDNRQRAKLHPTMCTEDCRVRTLSSTYRRLQPMCGIFIRLYYICHFLYQF